MQKDAIHVRAEKSLKEDLALLAAKERRTVSNLVIKILSDWVEEQKEGRKRK